MINVLVIGDGIIDKFTWGSITRQSPEDSSVPVVDVLKEELRLGGAYNVACNLKSLNKKNDVWVSSPCSLWTVEELDKKNITSDVFPIFSDSTSPAKEELIKERIIDSTTGKQIVRIDNRTHFDEWAVLQHKDQVEKTDYDGFDCIVVSDYNKGTIVWPVVDKLKQYDGPIFVDTKKKDLSAWKDFKNIFVKINWDEFQKSEHSNYIKNLIVTHAGQPVQLRKHDQLVAQFDVVSVENPDVTGAGDVFLAAFVVGFFKQKRNTQKAIQFAIQAASKSVSKQGTCEVYETEL